MVTENGVTTQEQLSDLANQLGLTNWRQWLDEFGVEVVTAALVAYDLDTLPFMGGGGA